MGVTRPLVRVIGQVYLDGVWINRELVAQGRAKHATRHSRSPTLAAAQTTAQSKSLGLWHHIRHEEARVIP